jgi:sulfotransferase family protein
MEQRAETSKRIAKETTDYHGRDPYLFIVGCARSGTTLVHRIVDAHPQIAITPEIHWISRQFKSRNALVTPELVSELTGHKRFAQFEIPREQFGGLLGSGEAIPYPTFLNRVFGLYGKINNKPLVGNKTSGYVRRIPTLHALWPEAKFVHIIRDGRDVCLSVLNWKKAERTAGRYASWEEDPVSTTALWWERKVRKAREDGGALGPGLYHETLYEDLVDDPERECKRLCEFLGVPYDDAMIRFAEGKTRTDLPNARKTPKKAWLPITSGLRNWRTQMSDGDVERFEAAAGNLLEELGYERTFSRPMPQALEHATRIRKTFSRVVQEREELPPERWWQSTRMSSS